MRSQPLAFRSWRTPRPRHGHRKRRNSSWACPVRVLLALLNNEIVAEGAVTMARSLYPGEESPPKDGRMLLKTAWEANCEHDIQHVHNIGCFKGAPLGTSRKDFECTIRQLTRSGNCLGCTPPSARPV